LNAQPQEDLCASWVAGRWLSGTGEPSVVTSPIDGSALHSFHAAGEAEIEAAIVGAQHAAKALAETTQADRAAALRALAAGLRRRAEAIAEATILANGCPRKQALAMQALSAVALLEAFAPLAENHSLEETRKGLRGGAVIVRKGRGLWTSSGDRVPWHQEGGKGMTPMVVHIQMRPDPLAD
jgi:acyl-CoA reductase-like NAD-dependent aldehyde dehydrogenase